MNTKISVFVVCVEATIYLLLCGLQTLLLMMKKNQSFDTKFKQIQSANT